MLFFPPFFPKSAYQIVVEELHPHRTKREAGAMECYQVPVTYQNSLSGGAPYYFAAELPPGNLPEPAPFTVGDNRTYQGFWNPPLAPRKGYNIYFQAMSSVEKVSFLQNFAFSLPWGKTAVEFYKYSTAFVRKKNWCVGGVVSVPNSAHSFGPTVGWGSVPVTLHQILVS